MGRNAVTLSRRRKPQDIFGFGDFDRILDNIFTGPWPASGSELSSSPTFKPRVDVVNREKDFVLHAELPGLAEEDVNLTIEGDQLILKGEKKQEKKEENEGSIRIERSYGSFVRRFELPPEVDTEKVSAKFKNGVLEVKLPKSKEAKESIKKISIS